MHTTSIIQLATTALMVASYCGQCDCVRELIMQGADINLQREDGSTPLFKAAYKGHNDVIEELLKFSPSLSLLKVML
ncbi:UNVERIFIED_CONTAM: hypothetical protein FKN15_055720 [Acipenser sinensis]